MGDVARLLRSPLLVLLLACTLAACGDDDRPADAGTGGGGHGEGGMDAGDTDAGPMGCIPADVECTAPGGDECCEGYVCRATSSRAFCVEPDNTCFVAPRDGCCLDGADCEEGERCTGMECRPDGDGVCVAPLDAGECWTDADCASGETCSGSSLCPCGDECIVPDSPGTCG